jgi:hypothetical protein
MKDLLKIFTILAVTTFISCGKSNNKATTQMDFGEAHPNQIVEKTLVLNFNEGAMDDPNSYVEFSYLNADGTKPSGFEYTINGEPTKDNKLKFYASAFKNKSQEVKIGVKFPKGADQKKYEGNFVLTSASPDLEQNLTQGVEKVPAQIGDTVGKWNVIYSDPIPLWIKLLVGIGSLILLISLSWFILTRPDMPMGPKTFKKGILSFLDGNAATVNLEKLQKYDISKTLGIEEGLTLEPFDKLHQRKKQRFAKLKNNSSNLEVKVSYDGIEETIGVNQELYNLDEIKVKTQDNKTYLLSYSNNKIVRA